jgi:hypothetical protein
MSDRIVMVWAALAALSVGCSPATPEPKTDPGPISSVPAGGGMVAPAASASAAVVAAPAGESQSDLVAVATLPYDVNLYAFEGALVATALYPGEDYQAGVPAGIIESDRYIEKKELYLPLWMAKKPPTSPASPRSRARRSPITRIRCSPS